MIATPQSRIETSGDGVVQRIEISVGPFTFAPVKFNTFTVGPVRVSIDPLPNESAGDAYLRASKAAEWMFEQELKRARTKFVAMLRDNDRLVRE